MAYQVHLALLRQGVYVWNRHKQEGIDIPIDLSGANLKGADLSGAYLQGANLSRANLSGALFELANLSRAKEKPI